MEIADFQEPFGTWRCQEAEEGEEEEEEEPLELVDSSDEEGSEEEEDEEGEEKESDSKYKLTGEERAALRSILTGAVKHGHRMYQAKFWKNDCCRFCKQEVKEDDEHLWWQCGAWDKIRKKYLRIGTNGECHTMVYSLRSANVLKKETI